MPNFSDRVHRIADEGSSAWDIHYAALAAVQTDPDVIVLSVGDPDFSTPSHIVNALSESAQAGDTHYTPILGIDELRDAVAQKLRSQGAVHIQRENIAIVAGAQNALFAAAQCTLELGDEVITFDPAYVTYEATVGAAGAKLIRVTGDAGNGFRPNIDALEKAITAKTRAIAFSNPNNPTGTAFTAGEFERINALAIKYDLWVWSDEVYADLVFEHQHQSISHFDQMNDRAICIGSLSKSHAMTGWRVGWIAGPAELIGHVENLSLCMLYGLPEFIQKAGAQAITHGELDVQQMRTTYCTRRDLLVSQLQGLSNVSLLIPQAGMFLLMDIRDTGLSSQDFVKGLYEQYNVSVLDGAAFSPALEGFLRLSFTNGETALIDACERIKIFINQLEK